MPHRLQTAIQNACGAIRALPPTDEPLARMRARNIDRGKYDKALSIRQQLFLILDFLTPFCDTDQSEKFETIPRTIVNPITQALEKVEIIASEMPIMCQPDVISGTVPPSYNGNEGGVTRQVEQLHGQIYSPLTNLRPSPEKRPLDIAALLGQGENDLLEFKASARWDFEKKQINKELEFAIAKTVAGFLNAGGGVLVIGVNDDGSIVGLENDYKTLGKRPDHDGYQQFLVTLVSNTLGKVACAAVKFEFSDQSGKDICIIRCSPSPEPVYVGEKGAFYARIGNTTQELNPRDAANYIARRWKN